MRFVFIIPFPQKEILELFKICFKTSQSIQMTKGKKGKENPSWELETKRKLSDAFAEIGSSAEVYEESNLLNDTLLKRITTFKISFFSISIILN